MFTTEAVHQLVSWYPYLLSIKLINQNMFNHSIKPVQIHTKLNKKQMYKIKLAREFNYNTEHNKVYILPNNKTYKYYFIA